MPEFTHSEVPCPAPIRASGSRRLTLEMRVRLDQADRFTGLPRGTAKPLMFLAAFQEAEPYLGLPAHAYKLVSFLVKSTRPCDWEEGSRPIAWPSARREIEFLGLSPTRVKALNRALFEAGILVIRDNEQGKRYGRRGPDGRIVEAFGFDLSPLAQRYDEFVRIAAEARAERDRMKKLRRRATLARRGIAQAVEELAAQGHGSDQLTQLVRDTAELVIAARQALRSDELALAVKALERRKAEAEQTLRDLVEPVKTDPEGAENGPHQYTTTTLTVNDSNHTVIARRDSSRLASTPEPDLPCPAKPDGLFPERLRVTPAQLLELAPALAPYMPAQNADQTWPAIIEAALWLSGELGINRTLWGRACQTMGREYAAVALALVSTKPAGHFTSGPGGYFAGMLRKYEKGELHLDRTLWKLRDQLWGNDQRRAAARR